MLGQRFGRDGPERAGPDVQRQRTEFHALLRQPVEQGCGEVQPGRRRRHRARHLGVDRLVVLPIGSRPFRPCGCRAAAARVPPAPAARRHPRSASGRATQVPSACFTPSWSRTSSCPVGVEQRDGVARLELAAGLAHHPPQAVGARLQKKPFPVPARVRRRPTSRAGTTRVSLITRQSSRRRISGRSRMCLCSNDLRSDPPPAAERRSGRRPATGQSGRFGRS